jgi:hypothetical protein
MPWGSVPILEVNGKVIAQSYAIVRYLAKKLDLYGPDPFECAKVDEYAYAVEDLRAGNYIIAKTVKNKLFIRFVMMTNANNIVFQNCRTPKVRIRQGRRAEGSIEGDGNLHAHSPLHGTVLKSDAPSWRRIWTFSLGCKNYLR